MNDIYLKKLEFDKILRRLSDEAVSEPAKDKLLKLRPMEDLYEIDLAQKETSDALDCLRIRGDCPFTGLADVTDSILRTQKEAVLSMEELLKIALFIDGDERVRDYGRHGEEDPIYQALNPMFEGLMPPVRIEKEIRRCIASEDEMFDQASSHLAEVRRQIHLTQERIRSTLNGMLRSQTYKTMLQDAVITQRQGRYCLPVKAEYKGSFRGLVHDQSGSGSTLFIEPMSVVELNNQISELEIEEKKEIRRILSELSGMVSSASTELIADYELLVHLDFCFAKARFAKKMDAVKPDFTDQPVIHLPKARHPLLDPKLVVPVSIDIGDGYTSLIITGPNTGGKTVTLKTLGLLQAMGQAGLHVPTGDGPKLAVLDQIYADIGDEQSIEQSLSTFSSHMVNLVEILKTVSPRSLVLLDELGAGTDPTEGAALAMAILESLRKQQVLTAATTHYSELKVYALSTDGVMNASCEFDVDTLKPTYRLLIGVPGKSNAFAISRRLGLPESIIEDAAALLESQDIQFEEMLTDLETRRVQLEEEQQRLEALKAEAEQLHLKSRKEAEKLARNRDRELEKARSEASRILQEAKAEADETLRDMNRLIREGQAVDVKALEQMRSRLRESAKAADLKAKKEQKKNDTPMVRKEWLKPDVRVKLKDHDPACIVVTPPDDKGRLYVLAGMMKMQVNVQDIECILPAEKEQPVRGKGHQAGTFHKAQTIHLEIDLRGMTTEEALQSLDKYMDDCYLAGVPKVTVIHGKGTGALRKACQDYLRRSNRVKSYRLGTYGEGESGVTIVELKSEK